MVPHILLAVFRNTPRALAAARRRAQSAELRRVFLINLRFELRRAGVRCEVESIRDLYRGHGYPVPARWDVRRWLDGSGKPTLDDGYHLGLILGVLWGSMFRRGHRRDPYYLDRKAA